MSDRAIARYEKWHARESKKLIEEFKAALEHASTLKGDDLREFVYALKKRVAERQKYLNSNYGRIGPLTFSSNPRKWPKPDLITGKEAEEE